MLKLNRLLQVCLYLPNQYHTLFNDDAKRTILTVILAKNYKIYVRSCSCNTNTKATARKVTFGLLETWSRTAQSQRASPLLE